MLGHRLCRSQRAGRGSRGEEGAVMVVMVVMMMMVMVLVVLHLPHRTIGMIALATITGTLHLLQSRGIVGVQQFDRVCDRCKQIGIGRRL